jgi:hypothetical protein
LLGAASASSSHSSGRLRDRISDLYDRQGVSKGGIDALRFKSEAVVGVFFRRSAEAGVIGGTIIVDCVDCDIR